MLVFLAVLLNTRGCGRANIYVPVLQFWSQTTFHHWCEPPTQPLRFEITQLRAISDDSLHYAQPHHANSQRKEGPNNRPSCTNQAISGADLGLNEGRWLVKIGGLGEDCSCSNCTFLSRGYFHCSLY